MMPVLFSLLWSLRSSFRVRADLQAEILALRHQLLVLQRRNRNHRLELNATDRMLWVWLSRFWPGWRSALLIVKPETVIAWHRKGFRLYWTWKSRLPNGRPSVAQEIRDLIRKMSLANPRWGAPRIHGELLKLGIEVSQGTVAKYMVRHRKPPSQSWRTFLKNHVKRLGLHRLLRRTDGDVPVALRFCGALAQSTPAPPLPRGDPPPPPPGGTAAHCNAFLVGGGAPLSVPAR